MRFLKSVNVLKNVKGWIFWGFLTSTVLQNIETNEGGTFGAIRKVLKNVA